jgi:MFS transporter, AAHS family, 4-hydroxybenzoate transporter
MAGNDVTSGSAGVELANIIDQSKFNAFQLRVVILLGLVILFDGFDVQVITYVAPILTGVLRIDRSMLGPVFSAALVGTMAGAFLFGPLADRFGPKKILVCCVLLFSLCTLATTTMSSITELLFWRFLGGLGLGGATPIAVALASEYCPKENRASIVMTMYAGYSVGAAGGGLLSAFLVQEFGWESVFLVGGTLPLILTLLLLFQLPESLRFLVSTDANSNKAADLVSRIDPNFKLQPAEHFVLSERETGGFPVGLLFREGRALRTIVVWIMFFANIISLYFMISWFPTLINGLGVPLKDAVIASSLIQIGSLLGTITLATLVRKFSVFGVLGSGFMLGGVSLLLVASAGAEVPYIMLVAFIAGFFVIGTQTGANAATALVYPSRMRATGIGWALGVGRIGSFVGPAIGGLLIGLKWSIPMLFIVAALPALLAAIMAFLLSVILKKSEAAEKALVANPSA